MDVWHFPRECQVFNITFLELYPIVLAVHLWRNHSIIFHTDNQALISILNLHTSRDADIMCMVRRMVLKCMKNDNLSRVMKKPTFYICENKDAGQLRGDREADQRLCFRYIDSTIPLLSKSEISSLLPSSVAVQPGLCRTWSETRTLVFS